MLLLLKEKTDKDFTILLLFSVSNLNLPVQPPVVPGAVLAAPPLRKDILKILY